MSSIKSLPDVMRMLRRRLWLIMLVALIGSVVSVIVALNQPKVYEATAVIQIETPQVDRDGRGQIVGTDARHRVQLIEQRLMSRDHLIEIIDRHGLFADATAMPMGEKIYKLRISARITPITVNVPSAGPAASIPSGLSITVKLSDPQKAADVANDFVNAVITQNRERRMQTVRETLDFYSAEEARVETRIVALEEQIADFKRANADALPDNMGAMRDQLSTLQETLLDIEQQIITLETESVRQRQEVFDRQIGQLTEQRDLVARRIAEIETAIEATPRVERELSALTRALGQLQEQLDTIIRNRVEAEIASVLESRQQQERFEILETAIPPEFPVSTSRKKLAFAGGVASLILGLVLALVWEIMNPVLRTSAQVRDELDITPVVSIPVVPVRGELRARLLKRLGALVLIVLILPVLIRLVQERLMPLRQLGGN
jgi:uncharacterized protein involved in exopolysaccharide biosynthesis